jgi:hypothetical protein
VVAAAARTRCREDGPALRNAERPAQLARHRNHAREEQRKQLRQRRELRLRLGARRRELLQRQRRRDPRARGRLLEQAGELAVGHGVVVWDPRGEAEPPVWLPDVGGVVEELDEAEGEKGLVVKAVGV